MPEAMHESLRLYSILKMMKWSHLPADGGLYAQDPQFIDDMLVVASVEAKVDRKRMDKDKPRGKGARGSSAMPAGASGRRRR